MRGHDGTHTAAPARRDQSPELHGEMSGSAQATETSARYASSSSSHWGSPGDALLLRDRGTVESVQAMETRVQPTAEGCPDPSSSEESCSVERPSESEMLSTSPKGDLGGTETWTQPGAALMPTGSPGPVRHKSPRRSPPSRDGRASGGSLPASEPWVFPSVLEATRNVARSLDTPGMEPGTLLGTSGSKDSPVVAGAGGVPPVCVD